MERFQLPQAVQRCCDVLRSAGYGAYPVGGCVRDLLLGKVPADWDVATSATPAEMEALFPHTVPTGIAHGTVTVLLEDTALEVTSFRSEGTYSDGRHPDGVQFGVSLEEDLKRRDFTINAMALDGAGAVIDPFGGQRDLAAGVLRCVGDPDKRFREDALRMLRCLRFGAQLGFSVEGETLAALTRNAPLAARLSAERVVAEVQKTLLSPRPEAALALAALGLLAPYLPAGDGDARYTAGDGDALRAAHPTPEGRWRVFCRVTGLEIDRLPVSRSIRKAVHYCPAEDPRTLAVTGGELYAQGLRGAEIRKAQQRLLTYVAQHPAENQKERLLEILRQN
ncbi:MAG: tRNA nucleotidyltransferase [Oscillospiraceae bacterium]